MKTKVKYLQDCKMLDDFRTLAAKVTNMCDAEVITRMASKVCGEDNSLWRRNFMESNFKRFERTEMYSILMGTTIGDKSQYHYVPNPL